MYSLTLSSRLAGRRQVIELALKKCPVGTWVQVDDLFRHMQSIGLNFEITRDLWRLYIVDQEHGSLGYADFHSWDLCCKGAIHCACCSNTLPRLA